MNFLILGHTVSDVINEPAGKRSQPGGIFYTISALLSVKENTDRLYLVSSLDEKHKYLFKNVYDRIETGFVRGVDAIPTVQLKIFDDKEREECYLDVTDRLELEDLLKSDLHIDGILINMITGTEISPEDLKNIRDKFSAPVYFDLHTLSRGIDSSNRRYFRVIPEVGEWLKNMDILQVNENEMLSLGFGEAEFSVAEKVFNFNPSIFIVTQGEKGSRIFVKTGREFFSLYQKALEVNSVNKVGCGDIFGAVFFYSYIKYRNIYESFKLADNLAGLSTTYKNINDLVNLKNDFDKFTYK